MEPRCGDNSPGALRAEHLTFGKVVTGVDRTVPSWSQYGITRRSSGIACVFQQALVPEALLGASSLSHTSIVDTAAADGALVGRLIDLPRVRETPLRSFVALRFRFRPEGGEGTPSRLYLQARCLIIPWLAWASSAPQVLDQILGGLRAEPDYAVSARDININDTTLKFDLQPIRPFAFREDVRDSIIDWAERKNGPDVLELGDESVQNETEFLAVLAAAHQTAPMAFFWMNDFGFSCGYDGTVPGRSLRYVAGRDCSLTDSDRTSKVNHLILEFLRWQKLLVDAALSADGGQSQGLFETTRGINALLVALPDRDRNGVEEVLPPRERAFLHLISAAAGWRDAVTHDDLAFARDAEALIHKLAQSELWRRAEANVGKLIAA